MDTATTEIYTLSLHDALPILEDSPRGRSGDFVIRVSCSSISGPWEHRQFTHNDLLRDVAAKTEADGTWVKEHLLPALCEVVKGSASPIEASCTLKCPLAAIQIGRASGRER